LFVSFGILSGSGSSKKVREGLKLVWHSVIWVIWKVKKENIFNNHVVSALEVVDESKGLVWRWYLVRMAKTPFPSYEWFLGPFNCLAR